MADITIEKALEELRTARDGHTAAVRAEDIARRAETNARNRLNEAQKAFDEAVQRERKAASTQGSDWHQSIQRKLNPPQECRG